MTAEEYREDGAREIWIDERPFDDEGVGGVVE